MNTLADIIALGDNAATAGNPLTHNWRQVRGCAAFFGRACNGLDQCPIATFETRFPEDFGSLAPEDRDAFPTKRIYVSARNQIIQTLVQLGVKEDPWERLYGLIRKTVRRDQILNYMSGLKTPALKEGLAPADIRADWVWSLAAEADGGSRRLRLRRAVVMFDSLFDIPAIAKSGVLPPERIGPPPSADIYGRQSLPPKLDTYQTALEGGSSQRGKNALPQMWQAITAAGGLGLSNDPSAQDLVEVWPDIRSLPASLISLAEPTWKTVHQLARQALAPHATTPATEVLPPHFEAMIETDFDRWALKTLWRQMLATMVSAPKNVTAHDLLELETWRVIWRNKPESMSASTYRPYEIRSRKILLRHAPDQIDPLRRVTRAWADLPKLLKSDLAPIRKVAEKAFLRPLEITPEWLSGMGLNAEQRAQADSALDAVAAAEASPPETPPTPIEVTWQSLRAAARRQGFDTSRFGLIITLAVRDSRLPSTIDRGWATRVEADFPDQRQRAKYRMQIRNLDSMLADPCLAPHLYGQPIGRLPDRRKRGAIDMPDSIARELSKLYDILGLSESSRREARTTVRKLITAAVGQGLGIETLENILRQADTLSTDRETLRKAKRILSNMNVHPGL